jgi:phosphatidylinositol alpha-1,6-mannosyltransferase
MKKTLFITNDFPPIVSGISTVFYEFLKRVDRNNYIVIAPKIKGANNTDQKGNIINVKRIWIPTGESAVAKIFKTILDLFYILFFSIIYKPSVIHCGQILSNTPGALLCKKILNIPYIVWVYGSETIRFGKYKILKKMMKWILKEAKRVVVISSFTEDEYIKFGVSRDKIVKLTPGVDTKFFIPKDRDKELIKKYFLEDRIVLLTVGRLDERKGHDMVLEAISGLIPYYPNLIYLIVGKGREEERLREIVSKKELKNNVIFVGYVENDRLPDYYNLCDIFILPNRITEKSELKGDYEGFGIVFLEASACGKPVIGGKSGGTFDAIKENITGYLVNPLLPSEIASAIKKLLSDHALREKMGKSGRDWVVKNFDWEILINKFNDILI